MSHCLSAHYLRAFCEADSPPGSHQHTSVSTSCPSETEAWGYVFPRQFGEAEPLWSFSLFFWQAESLPQAVYICRTFLSMGWFTITLQESHWNQKSRYRVVMFAVQNPLVVSFSTIFFGVVCMKTSRLQFFTYIWWMRGLQRVVIFVHPFYHIITFVGFILHWRGGNDEDACSWADHPPRPD